MNSQQISLFDDIEAESPKPKRDITLFDYQQETVCRFLDWYEQGPESEALIALTMGLGKTITAAACIRALLDKQSEHKILWLTHRDELLQQAKEEVEEYTGLKCEIEKAQKQAFGNAPIIVASVHSVRGKRLERLCQLFDPDLIVCDEAHHSLAATWMQIKQAFFRAKILNLSATPYRSDVANRLDLGRVLMEKNTSDGIRMGRLVPPKPVGKVEIDLGKVKKRLGDYEIDSLSEMLCQPEVVAACTEVICQNATGHRSILFAVTVNHGRIMARGLRAKGFRVGEVYGETPIPERRQYFKDIEQDRLDILVNNMVLTEGFNMPCLDVAIVLRPTKNAALYLQMVGRGLRKDPNNPAKTHCLIIDVLDTAKRKTGGNVIVLPSEDDRSRFSALHGKPSKLARVFLDWFFKVSDVERVVAKEITIDQCAKLQGAQELYDLLTPRWYRTVKPSHQKLVEEIADIWTAGPETDGYDLLLPGFRCNNQEAFVKLMRQKGWAYFPHNALPKDEEEMEEAIAGMDSPAHTNYTLSTLISQDADLKNFLIDIFDSNVSLKEQAAKCYEMFEDCGHLLAWFKTIRDYGVRFHFIQFKDPNGEGIILIRTGAGRILRFLVQNYKPVPDSTYKFNIEEIPPFVRSTSWAEKEMSENQAPAVAKILEVTPEELRRIKVSKLAASALMSNHWNRCQLKRIADWLKAEPAEEKK